MLPDRPDVPGRTGDDNGLVRRHHPLGLAALALALAAPAHAEPPGSSPAVESPGPDGPVAAAGPAPGGARPTLAVVDGVVRDVDLAGHGVTLEVDGKPVVLGLDRNTLVYLPSGLSTVFALRPGEIVRAGRDGAFVAYWVAVRSAPAAPTPSTPGQGTGPGGGSPPPPEGPGVAPAPGAPGRGAAPPASPGPG